MDAILTIIKNYWALVGGWKIISIIALMGVDTIMGIILAIKNTTFKWTYLNSWLDTSVVKLLAGYFLLGAAMMATPELAQLITMSAVMAMIDAQLINDLRLKFQAFGITVPAAPPATPAVPKTPGVHAG